MHAFAKCTEHGTESEYSSTKKQYNNITLYTNT